MRGTSNPVARQIGKETFTIQDTIDELLLSLRKGGKVLNHKLEMDAFYRQAKDEALARKSGKDQMYFLNLGNRVVGPHRLEKLQEWVAIEVISPNLLVRGIRAETFVEMANLETFFQHGPALRKKLSEYRKRPLDEWWTQPVTARQITKLRFFDLPFVREGLTKGRASEYLENWSFIDPKKDAEYNEMKKAKE